MDSSYQEVLISLKLSRGANQKKKKSKEKEKDLSTGNIKKIKKE